MHYQGFLHLTLMGARASHHFQRDHYSLPSPLRRPYVHAVCEHIMVPPDATLGESLTNGGAFNVEWLRIVLTERRQMGTRR
jgi:hypothetical protein